MIKSEIKSNNNTVRFPKLMKCGDIIILAAGLSEYAVYAALKGTAIIGDEINTVGRYSETWDAKSFVDFHGELTLKNVTNQD